MAGRIGNDAFERDALAAPQRVERDQRPRAGAEHDALVAVDLLEHPADIGIRAPRPGDAASAATATPCRSRSSTSRLSEQLAASASALQRHAAYLARELEPRSQPARRCGIFATRSRLSRLDFIHPLIRLRVRLFDHQWPRFRLGPHALNWRHKDFRKDSHEDGFPESSPNGSSTKVFQQFETGCSERLAASGERTAYVNPYTAGCCHLILE